jgi:transcriptional regulator with XRE-family HTH domain
LEPTIQDNIAYNIDRIFRASGLKKGEFEQTFGMSQGLLARYIEGKVMPKVDLLYEIANYYGLTLDEMVKQPKGFESPALEQFVKETNPELYQQKKGVSSNFSDNKDLLIKLLQEKLYNYENNFDKILEQKLGTTIVQVKEIHDILHRSEVLEKFDEALEKLNELRAKNGNGKS